MSLKEDSPPALPPAGRASIAWVLAVVLIGGAAAAVVVASVASYPPAPGGPLTVTDDLNRTVHLNPDPARVVALGPSIVDILDRLGLRSHVVGVDCYNGTTPGALGADYTPQQIAAWNLSASMCVEAYPFVPATLANLTPDLVLASTIVSIPSVEQTTGELGIPLIVLQPVTPDGILLDDLTIGTIFGVQGPAASLNGQLAAQLANASQVTSAASSFPSVLLTYSVDGNGYWTFGLDSFGQFLLELAGAASIAATAASAYPELSPAQVLSAEPDWIVYATGFGLTLASYAAGPDWSSFTAVSDGNLSGLDSTLFTEPGPTMILVGLPALLAIFHPS